jgi:hypothetical protein
MAICAEQADPNVRVETILRVFNREFPDREVLRLATGWTPRAIAQIDEYDGLPDVFSFATANQLLTLAGSYGDVRLVGVNGYELAERCPLLVMDVRS